LVLGFVVFLVDQGGVVLDRTKTTAESSQRSDTAPINPRITSWKNAIGLVKMYPLLGAGPQRFLEATRVHFPATARHVAHNTFFNFAANLGIIAAFIYLSFFWIAWKMYKWNKSVLDKHGSRVNIYINKAGICSLVGFFVGSMFLDLIIFEPFFFLLLILIVNNFLLKQKVNNTLPQVTNSSLNTSSSSSILQSQPFSKKRNQRV
jgi:O-antigen ligase